MKQINTVFVATMFTFSALAHADDGAKLIAKNAGTSLFSTLQQFGMSGVIKEIQQCYPEANSRDAIIHCIAMDIQASQLDAGISKKLGAESNSYFDESSMNERIGLLEPWLESNKLVTYTMNQILDGVDEARREEVERISKK